MQIVIKGTCKNITKRLIRKAAEHYADKLMNERLHENIHCTITMRDWKNDDDHGTCLAYYDEHNIARLFDIEINKNNSHKRILETLAHEMVHLKQYAKNEWYEYDRTPNRHRFKGEILDIDKEFRKRLLAGSLGSRSIRIRVWTLSFLGDE